jgi:hypothetical protein
MLDYTLTWTTSSVVIIFKLSHCGSHRLMTIFTWCFPNVGLFIVNGRVSAEEVVYGKNKIKTKEIVYFC